MRLKTSGKKLTLNELQKRIKLCQSNPDCVPKHYFTKKNGTAVLKCNCIESFVEENDSNRDVPNPNFASGISEEQWTKLERDGYCVFKQVIDKVEVHLEIEIVRNICNS